MPTLKIVSLSLFIVYVANHPRGYNYKKAKLNQLSHLPEIYLSAAKFQSSRNLASAGKLAEKLVADDSAEPSFSPKISYITGQQSTDCVHLGNYPEYVIFSGESAFDVSTYLTHYSLLSSLS